MCAAGCHSSRDWILADICAHSTGSEPTCSNRHVAPTLTPGVRRVLPPPPQFCHYNGKRSLCDLRMKPLHSFITSKSQGDKREGLQCRVLHVGAEMYLSCLAVWLTDWLIARKQIHRVFCLQEPAICTSLESCWSSTHHSFYLFEISFSNILPPIPGCPSGRFPSDFQPKFYRRFSSLAWVQR
jgi:hypothetical protein